MIMSCPVAMKRSAYAILLLHTKNVLSRVQLLIMTIDPFDLIDPRTLEVEERSIYV